MGTFWQDIRYGFRVLWKRPVGTMLIVCTTGLLIGTLSLALGTLQHERSAWMPFPEPERLVRLWRVGGERPNPRFPASVYAELRRQLRAVESIGAVGGHQSHVLTGRGEPRSLIGLRVSSSTFSLSGIRPLLGRTFTADGERSGRAPLVVLSHQFWQEQFGGDESVLGQTLKLDGIPHVVLGVMRGGFNHNALFYGTDIWLRGDFESQSAGTAYVEIVARVKPGSSLSQLRAELDVVAPPIVEAYASSRDIAGPFGNVSAFALDKTFGRIEAGAVIFVIVIPLFVLLIACFNIANILLARVASRSKEIAVRSSLGAGRWRLIRQLLTESVLLAFCGGLTGLVGAVWISGWAATKGVQTKFGAIGLVGVSALTLVIGLLVGWLPAWRATRRDLVTDLKEGGGSSSGGPERHRLRGFLVCGQVAMATVLCISAGFLVRAYLNQREFDPEFETKNLVSISVSLRQPPYEDSDRRLLYCEQALERIRSVAGVEEVAVCSTASIDRNPFLMSFRLEGDADQWKRDQMVKVSIVSPNYLEMVNVPVLAGRPLSRADNRHSGPVCLVNQSFAEQFFGESDPIGQQISMHIEEGHEWFAIVGVVPDRRNLGSRENLGAEAYLSHQQVAPRWAQYFFLTRTRSAPGIVGNAIRRAVRSVDPDQPASSPWTVESRLERARCRDAGGAQAVTAIGLFGLIMAVLGIYGVVSNSISERTHELGVRIAMGAERSDILRFIVSQGMKLTLIGLGVGVVLAIGTTICISRVLFGVGASDLSVYFLVSLILVGTAFVASLVPALKAAKVHPSDTLRYE